MGKGRNKRQLVYKERARQVKGLKNSFKTLEGFVSDGGIEQGVFLQGVEMVEAQLREAGIAQGDRFWKRLKNIKGRYFAKMEEEKPVVVQAPINFTQGKRDYAGMSGKTKVRVTPVYDHLFFSRTYSGRIKLSWRFNREGRTELVDLMLFPQNEVFNVITSDNLGSKDADWNRSGAYYSLTNYLNCLNKDFSFLEDSVKLSEVLRYGHQMAHFFSINLKNFMNAGEGENTSKFIRDPHILQTGQMPLREMVYDDVAINIMKKAGSIKPHVGLENERRVEVIYV